MPLTSPRFARDARLQKVSDNNPPMKQGERNDSVATVQRALVDLGFAMPITTANGTKLADGIFGSETARVVRQFQTINGLDVDGVVGRQTMGRLEQLIAIYFAQKKTQQLFEANLPGSMSPTSHQTLGGRA